MAADLAHARRELRRARVSAALGEPMSAEVVARNRDRLLQPLAVVSVRDQVSFADLDDDTVETVISIAVAAVEDSGEDAAAVLLLCVQVLATDGQFARMALLADRLMRVASRFELSRPFWQLALAGLSDSIRGRRKHALDTLSERLVSGAGPSSREPVVHGRQHVEDVLASAALRQVLLGMGTSFAVRVRERALNNGDGELLTFTDALLAWASAIALADPQVVLPRADAVFAAPELEEYMAGLRVQSLFPAQIQALDYGMTRHETRVVALPTSSGKTLLAELRVIASLARYPGSHAIYVAPYRMLSRQVTRQLAPGLRRAGYTIRDLGSGYNPTAVPLAEAADVLVCTPERLDALMRLAASTADGHQAAAAFLDGCSVLVFDELHLIGRSGRGPRFDLILARLRMRNPNLRLLGLAAATHGSQELSEWLGDTVRPGPIGRPTGTLELVWQTDGTMKQRSSRAQPSTVMALPRTQPLSDAATLMLRFDGDHLPVLAICTQRSRAESLARRVLDGSAVASERWRASLSEDRRRMLLEAVEEVRALLGEDHPLARMMESGVAFHHAGVPTHTLEQIEKLARYGILRFVCATTTVAEGADLPFKVVVIPHLDFPGSSRRLERDLYLNIIGRAGRANVAVEGMVFILDSDARTLDGVVEGALWQTAARDVLRGQLNNVSLTPRTVEEWNAVVDVQSQVLAWLADSSSYVEEQARQLSARTFSFAQGSQTEKRAVLAIVQRMLTGLENGGYAVAGSPLRATPHGSLVQLTGLSLPAVRRLQEAIGSDHDGWLRELGADGEVSADHARNLSRLVFEAPEVFQHGLWFNRHAKGLTALATLRRFAYSGENGHVGSADHELDIELLSLWVRGASYTQLAESAGVARRASSLFGGTDLSKRTSDATQYIGKLTYPASWVWSGVQILSAEFGLSFPGFVRGAIEHGVPTEACVHLIESAGVTRAAALSVGAAAGQSWPQVATWLLGDRLDELAPELTRADSERLRNLRARLEGDWAG